jgi:DNA-binding MarR family transcriptional regulator
MNDKATGGGATDPPAFQLLNEVGIIDQLAQHRALQLLAPAINMPQFIVLNHLVRRGSDAAQIDLAHAMQVTKGAMSNTVARLLEKGYITVRADPDDARGKRVSLSTSGRRARDRAVAKLGRGLEGMAEVLSAQEVEYTLMALRKLRVWFDGQR